MTPVTRGLCDGASGPARCLHSRSVAARELVGAVDGTVPGGRLRAAGARLAGNLGHGRGNPEPRRPGGREGHRGCRRALRADHPRPGRAAHRDRPLLRRPDRPATAGPGPRGRGGGDRPGADQGRDLPAPVGAAGRLDRAAQPGEPEQGDSADPRAVPLWLRERAARARVRRAVPAVDGPVAGQAAVRGRHRGSVLAVAGQGQHRQQDPRSAAGHRRGPRPHRPGGDQPVDPQALSQVSRRHRPARVQRPGPLAHHRPRLARDRRRGYELAHPARYLAGAANTITTSGAGTGR